MVIRLSLLTVCLCVSVFGMLGAPDSWGHGTAPVRTNLVVDQIDITTGFNGATLEIYGVKDPKTDVVIVLRGPDKDMLVRKKAKTRAGWRYAQDVLFQNLPSYYRGVSSADPADILPKTVRQKYMLGLDTLTFKTEGVQSAQSLSLFKTAYVRTQIKEHFLARKFQAIETMGPRFFKAKFDVPHNVPVGIYIVQVFAVRGGKIVGTQWHDLYVSQVGVNAHIHGFAKSSPFFYGIVCVFLAILAGWISNRLKRIL